MLSAPTFSQPNYSMPNYSQPNYSQPNYSQPNYNQPNLIQPKRLPNLELIASINASLAKKNDNVPSPPAAEEDDSDAAGKRRKRKSRWGTDDYTDKLFIPGMPTILPGNLSKEQEEAYLRKLIAFVVWSCKNKER